jgi:hypothetical protein
VNNIDHSGGYLRAYRHRKLSGSNHRWSVSEEGYEVMEWIARALRNPNARITGAVYLLYFLTAIYSRAVIAAPPWLGRCRVRMEVKLVAGQPFDGAPGNSTYDTNRIPVAFQKEARHYSCWKPED